MSQFCNNPLAGRAALAGVGGRLDAAHIRGRIADPTRHDPDTVMPAYFRTENLRRVAPAWVMVAAFAGIHKW